ncbi:MAG: helix-turn-helix domain-containing protein [Eubacterium sp.]|nr:helix-turn-helix domain-containing protein [Eubacterium sp.]
MPVFRVEKSRDYTTMSNFHLRDKSLSLKAKGLLSQILSLPDNWNYSVSGLAAINKESRDSIRTAITELEGCGYIVRNRLRTNDGKLGDMEYVVHEKPVSQKPTSGEPTLEKPMLENPTQENPTQDKPTQGKPALENPAELNTYLPSTEKQNTDKSKKDGSKSKDVMRIYGRYQNVHLSDEDFAMLKASFPADYGKRIERLSEYIESSGKYYKNHYLTICQWARQDAEKARSGTAKNGFENYECKEGESY